jgi:hypothetical protein
LIASLGPMLASPVAKSKSQDEAKIPVGLHTTTRTVAYGLFDLASPSFEDELNAFLQLNLNNCSSCNGMTGTIPSKAVPYRASAPRRTSQANAASIAQSGDSHE